MKKRYSTLVLLGVITFFTIFTSCKKILEQEPKNSTYKEVFWEDPRAGSTAIAGNYAMLRDALTSGNFNVGNRHYMYGDAVAGNYFTLEYAGDGLENIQKGDYTFNYNIQSLGNWTKYYKVIAMSNTILKNMPEVSDAILEQLDDPEEFKNNIMGQAYFIRALSYFSLIRVWGDVPLVVEAYEDPISAPQLPRSPKAEVMKQIEEDCQKAIQLLAWGYKNASNARVTANKGSAYALLAHLYLWRATMTDVSSDDPIMSDVLSAESTLATLISEGGYRLTDTANYYSTFEGRSAESIFELNMSENTLEGSNRHIANIFLRKNYIDYNNDNSRAYVLPEYLSNHFYKVDTGWDWVWNEGLWQWEWKEISVKGLDDSDLRYRKNFDYLATNKPTCIKYHNVVYRDPGNKQNAYVSNNMIIFRLSDMLLLQAEIQLYKNNPGAAIDIINSFRIRNGASASAILAHNLTKDQVMYEYVLERGKELYLEGHNFYDLIRTRQYKEFVTWLPESRFKKEGFYWPVDPALFSENRFLKQTTYWLGKV